MVTSLAASLRHEIEQKLERAVTDTTAEVSSKGQNAGVRRTRLPREAREVSWSKWRQTWGLWLTPPVHDGSGVGQRAARDPSDGRISGATEKKTRRQDGRGGQKAGGAGKRELPATVEGPFSESPLGLECQSSLLKPLKEKTQYNFNCITK